MIGDYQSKYRQLIEDGLLEYVDTKKLIEFIFEQAIAKPEILRDLARFLGLTQRWSNFPGRRGKE